MTDGSPLFERPALPIWHPKMRATEEEVKRVRDGMEQAEKNGFFDALFKQPGHPVRYNASKEQLLRSIRPDMQLTKGFFLRIFGYSMTMPEFAAQALTRMKILGCSKAENYYSCIVAENEAEHQKQMKEAAEWYSKQLGEDRKKVVDHAGHRKPKYQFAGFPEDW